MLMLNTCWLLRILHSDAGNSKHAALACALKLWLQSACSTCVQACAKQDDEDNLPYTTMLQDSLDLLQALADNTEVRPSV